ncbi:MAG: hypothetical protein H7144_15965 [Burkholderiales bacterium]|nr:hypothetical protein [Phycisphaerae bacterium]
MRLRIHPGVYPLVWTISTLVSGIASAAISFTANSGTDWRISNGALTVNFNPTNSQIFNVYVKNNTDDILNPANSRIYPQFTGTPFGAGTMTSGRTQTADYIDFWTTTQSTGTAANPVTYSFHYVMFNNDPAIHMYELVDHSATDPATEMAQGQFLMRVDPDKFHTQHQVDPGPFNMGVKQSTLPDYATFTAAQAQPGRTVQDATNDFTGIPALTNPIGKNFHTKYDHQAYEQFHKGHLEYGDKYAVSTVIPSQESMSGGPTKQNLIFTDSILMMEFMSGHQGTTGYAYKPKQGVDTSRLYGPYVFRATEREGKTGDQLYAEAISTAGEYRTKYDTVAPLIANGYVPSTARGGIQLNIGSTAGWNANANHNTVVLSDNGVNFQKSGTGYQYWTQLSNAGAGTINGVVPGTYRMSIYQLGKWGETRVDNMVVQQGKTTLPQDAKFVPENFSTHAPIWTIGTPDRSSHEFLNGHSANGDMLRQYHGSYDFWKQLQDLGTPGKIVYYATAVPGHAATNDSNKWIANHWRKFNPGLYNPANATTDNYSNIAPQYVKDAGGPAAYNGLPWEVHFTTTAAQKAQGRYITLSVALAGALGDFTATLNGTSRVWNMTNSTTPAYRSADAGFFQWVVLQWDDPNGTLLKAAGIDNLLTISVGSNNGIMYDALRLEISGVSAHPDVTGWHDYDFVSSSDNTNNTRNANESLGGSLVQVFVPEPAAMGVLGAAAIGMLRRQPRINCRRPISRTDPA